MDKKSVNKRFISCIEYVLLNESATSKGMISEKIGMKANTFSEILNFRMNVATDHIANFIEVYPYISGEWILTGKGLMLKENQKEISKEESLNVHDIKDFLEISFRLGEQTNENKHLIEENLSLSEKIKELEIKIEILEQHNKKTSNEINCKNEKFSTSTIKKHE